MLYSKVQEGKVETKKGKNGRDSLYQWIWGMLGEEGCQIPIVYLQTQSSVSGPGRGDGECRRSMLKYLPGGPLPPVVWLSSPINLRLMACRTGNITHAVFPLHLSTVGHFHLQAGTHTRCQSWKRLLMCPGLASRLNISQRVSF